MILNDSTIMFMSFDELMKLPTRTLLLLYRISKSWRYYCSCGKEYHCGDDVLSESELAHNRFLVQFREKLKAHLDTLEHVPRPSERRAIREQKIRERRPMEKKRMRF